VISVAFGGNRFLAPIFAVNRLDLIAQHPLVIACLDAIGALAGAARPMMRLRGVPQDQHPLLALLWRPMPQMDWAQWVRVLVAQWWLTGRIACERGRDQAGILRQLIPLPAGRIAERYDQTTGDFAGITITRVDGREVVLAAEDVLWAINRRPDDPSRPWSRADALETVIRMDTSLMQYIADVTAQGMIRGALVTKEETTPEKRESIRERWDLAFGAGAMSKATTPIIDGTRAEYVRIGVAPSEVDPGALLAHVESRICGVLGVPPIVVSAKIGLDRSTYANYREARLRMWSDTVVPWLTQLAQVIEAQLAPEFNLRAEDVEITYDFDAVPGLDESRESQWQRAVQGWREQLLTRNEARALLGYARDEQGEVYRGSINDITEPAAITSE
jgi:HK97 family phage portal protein